MTKMKFINKPHWRQFVGTRNHIRLMHFFAFMQRITPSQYTPSKRDGKVAICAVFKDENQYVKEWIEYHLKIGVDYFLIYDNMSKIPLKDTIGGYITQGVAKVLYKDGQHDFRQAEAYNDSARHLQNYEWAAYIDIDEFIVLLEKETNIKEYLKKYDNSISVIGLNWLIFGSNGHKKIQKSVISSYTQSCPRHSANKHIKSIVRQSRFYWTAHPHFFFVTKGTIVNVKGDPIEKGSPFNDPPILDEVMRINHYHTRSYEDFKLKQTRGDANRLGRRLPDDAFDLDQKENIQNFDIVNLINRIQENAPH